MSSAAATAAPAYSVQTHYPIAFDSVDHLHPRGTKNDNSTNLEFNRRLFEVCRYMPFTCVPPSVMDLGCSGGGFVQSLVEMGSDAIGLEGSDYSKRRARAAWSEIPDRLFTVDLGRSFLVLRHTTVAIFDVVTAWEVLEHFAEEQLDNLMVTVHAHTRSGSLFIASITSVQDRFEGVNYHATLCPPHWWRGYFATKGWKSRPDLEQRFGAGNWVRGPHTDGPSSSCFVFQKS